MSITGDVSTCTPRLHLSKDMQQLVYRLLAAGLICVVLSVLSDAFFTANNILNVLRQASLLFFLASGLTLVILTGGIDLSVGANIGLSACLAATVIKATGSPVLGTLTGLATGCVVGIFNGLMVAKLRIPSFIATYGMLWVLHGATYYYMGGETIHGFPAGFRQIGSGYFLGVPIPVYLMVVFWLRGPSLPSAPSGASRSMPSAPIRWPPGSPAFRSTSASCWSTPFPAPWRGWLPSSSSPA